MSSSYTPRPPEDTLEVLTKAAQTILWEANADVVYLYGSAGRYYNKVEDPGTRTVGLEKQILPGRKFSGFSDFDIGVQTSNQEETFRLLGDLASQGRIPRSIESDQFPSGDIRQMKNRGYWPARHRISYAVHTDELHGRAQDRYILAE